MIQLVGKSIIGYKRSTSNDESLRAFNPATGSWLEPVYSTALPSDVDEAASLAHSAFDTYSRTSGAAKANFLRKIAGNIEALGKTLFERATQETGLPAGRIQSETARTCNQLRLFADSISEGSWVDARIDRPDPSRQPLPKPDVRSMLRPIGPVVVFGASNFPLAFSVAGGDTASALAAGNPVIVKAHHAHPGTSELVGMAIVDAARDCDLPEGVFSLLYGAGNEIGVALIKHPFIKAGGFTGSRSGGRALLDAATSRPEPIPFYAEMSSVNPVVLLPGAIGERADQLATALHGSVILGAGQFCTNPGLVLLRDDEESSHFIDKLADLMKETPGQTMLTPAISSTYQRSVTRRSSAAVVETLVEVGANPENCAARTALFKTDAASFLKSVELNEEIFGPSTLLITYKDESELLHVIESLEGQLTGTVHATDEELRKSGKLLNALETKVGRLLFNSFPTGVEVCHSMVHGGPYPATSDGRSTSVGTRAILRFTRQVCFQGFLNEMLPDELKDENPLGIWRLVDGTFKK